jgi:uncharacterized protein
MMLCDTSALVALVDEQDKHHQAIKTLAQQELIIPTTVLCEVDYFLVKYLGEHVAKRFFENVVANETLLYFDSVDLARVNQIRRQYNDLPLGFVDASLIALAERHGVRQILTLDRRHFSAVVPQGLGYLELLP